jgi:ribosome recycling factor
MQEQDLMNNLKTHMTQALEHLKQELRALRAGRASASIVEGIQVEAYGSFMRLKELGTITTPEARQLLITPYDVSNAQPIAKAIEKANLGVRAHIEGKAVRVFFPELDQNRRKELASQVGKKKEESKVTLRNIRRDTLEALKKMKQEGLPEDDVKRLEKHIQEFTDKHCKEADEIAAHKEQEIMTI